MECVSLLLVCAAGALACAVWRACSARRDCVDAGDAVVFISGCDSGLGRHLAVYFAGLGCEVVAGCMDPSRASLPECVTVVPLDVCDEDSVSGAVRAATEVLRAKGKDLWALVNNAGVCVYGEFEWQTWSQCQRQVDVNLLGTMRLTKAFLPLLRKSKGRIITVTSVNGCVAYPGLSVYSATKFALEGLHHAIRLELRRLHGIKVVLVAPGDLARLTSIMSRHERNAEEMWEDMSEEYRREYGPFFRMYHRVTMKNFGLTSPRSLDDSPLLRDMRDALLSKSPRARYVSAAPQYGLMYRFLALMPLCLVDGFLDKVTDMLFRTDEET